MKDILLIFTVLSMCFNVITAQNILYQDIFKGGVTGDSYNNWQSDSPGTFVLHIEPGSTIKKALLFTSMYNQPENAVFSISNQSEILMSQNNINDTYQMIGSSGYQFNIRTILTDVTQIIDPNSSSFTIEPPVWGNGVNSQNFYCEFYLLVAYENPLLNQVSFCVVVNNQPTNPVMNYYLSEISVIDTTFNVGLAVHTGHFCNSINDGSFIKVDGSQIGILGGNDINNQGCGVTGSFYYQNDSLFGLRNDIANNSMNEVDAIANIESYLTDLDSINIEFEYQSNFGPYSNPVHQLFLTYSTPCDTFTVNLQDKYQVCKGDSVQLQLAGGNDWEWEATGDNPQVGLSCYNCPQPYYTDTISRWYTVRIWNNDSCSKVLPVHISVLDNPPTPIVGVNATKCSDSSGVATVQVAEASYQYSINGGALQSSSVFTGLHAGTYSITVTDTNNCSASKDVLIGMTYPTAQFTANPPQGDVPLAVEFINQSSGATNYVWYVNEDTLYDTSPQVTFSEGGVFTTTLIAYDTYPQCADTVSSVILTEYPFVVFAPTLHTDSHTPYQIYTSGVAELTYTLYNEIGQLIINRQLTPANGNNELWSPYQIAKGVYFYRIVAKDAEGNVKEFSGKVVIQ